MANSSVKTSKSLSWLLRHGAVQEGLIIDAGGWAKVSDILQRPQFRQVSLEKIKALVADCPKQRFALEERDGELYIKANQGHTVQVEELDLTEIKSSEEVEAVIHGTYYKAWPSIQKQGLNRMKRNHIHFAPGLPGSKAEISGIRQSCQIFIYINLSNALESGYKFYRSANNVILCPGNEDGFLPPKYFLKVVDRKAGQQLM